MLWFLVILNKQYTVDLTFPVKVTNIPKNQVLVNAPPDNLTLRVRALGTVLLRYKLNMLLSPLAFNVNDFSDRRTELSQMIRYDLPTGQFSGKLSEQLSQGLQIIGIQPDTLTLLFDKITSRQVRVMPNIGYSLKKQHFINSVITTIPDSVTVTGPKVTVDTLKFVSTKYQSFKNLNSTIQTNIAIMEPKGLSVKPPKVTLKVPVEEYTEKILSVPISVAGTPDSIRVNLFPYEVKVHFLISLNRFNEVSAGDFQVNVSYDDILADKSLLEVSLGEYPPFIRSVSVIPQLVEYLIEK